LKGKSNFSRTQEPKYRDRKINRYKEWDSISAEVFATKTTTTTTR
jgi:hypothetical protein